MARRSEEAVSSWFARGRTFESVALAFFLAEGLVPPGLAAQTMAAEEER